jgi:hypothetical protein
MEAYLLDRLLKQASPGEEEKKHLIRLQTIQTEHEHLAEQIARVQNKVKQGQAISGSEQRLLEILAFYEQLQIYQDPSQYKSLFNGLYHQADIHHVSMFAGSTASQAAVAKANPNTQEPGCLNALHTDIRLYSISTLSEYLNWLQTIFDQQQQSTVVRLSSDKHMTAVSYNVHDKSWTFYDINSLPPQISNDTRVIAESIFRSYLAQQPVLANLMVFAYLHLFPKPVLANYITTLFYRYLLPQSLFDGCLISLSSTTITLGVTDPINQQLTANLTQQYLVALNQEDAEKADSLCVTILHIACLEGNIAIATRLLEKDINVNQATLDGSTPLLVAHHNGHRDIEQLLLEKNAEIPRGYTMT